MCVSVSVKSGLGSDCGPTSNLQVRTGRNTETFRTSGVYEQLSEDCAFSIIYGETFDSLDLVANSAEVANIWVTGLRLDHAGGWDQG